MALLSFIQEELSLENLLIVKQQLVKQQKHDTSPYISDTDRSGLPLYHLSHTNCVINTLVTDDDEHMSELYKIEVKPV